MKTPPCNHRLLVSTVLFAPSLLLASHAFELTSQVADFDHVQPGNAVDIAWTDAAGAVDITLLATGNEITIANGLMVSPYRWTPSANLSSGDYTLKVNDTSGDGELRTVTLDNSATSSSTSSATPTLSPGRLPPASHGSNSSNTISSAPFDGGEDSDITPLEPQPEDGAGGFPRMAIVGIAVGGACALALIVLLAVGTWTFRQKYLDVMRRYGDLLREVYGDSASSGAGAGLGAKASSPRTEKDVMPMRERSGSGDSSNSSITIMTPIPEEPEADDEGATTSKAGRKKRSKSSSSTQRKKWAEDRAARIRSHSPETYGGQDAHGSSSDETEDKKISGSPTQRGRSREGGDGEHDVGTTSLTNRDPFRDSLDEVI